MLIESLQNPRIRYLSRLLSDNRFRKKEGVFTVEGQQENERALRFGYEPIEFFTDETLFQNKDLPLKATAVSPAVYEKIAYRGTSEGIIGIYEAKENRLSDFQPKKDSAVIVVEGSEKPGNLGAILRSCEAFGIDALIVTDPKVDFYNPNVIRSSVGCLFGMNIFTADNAEALHFLQKHGYGVYPTLMGAESKNIQERDFRKKSAVIFGTEHSGLSEFWHTTGKNTLIPMSGTIDSLNLSNAVAIACYEILRQKG